MSDISPHAVESRLDRLINDLERHTNAYSTQVVDAAIAEATYRISFASAIKDSKANTDKSREAEATLRCADELRDRKDKEATAEATRMAIFSLREQIRGVQSIVASSRQLTS